MEHNGANAATVLSERQLLTLPYLVGAPSLTEAAKLADVGRTTIYRWMEDYEFPQELERLRSEAAELAHCELKGLMFKAVQVLGEAMEDTNTNVRLRAAQITLSVALKANELKEIQQRLQLLDDALPLWSTRHTKW